jgi:hypothetical protein
MAMHHNKAVRGLRTHPNFEYWDRETLVKFCKEAWEKIQEQRDELIDFQEKLNASAE